MAHLDNQEVLLGGGVARNRRLQEMVAYCREHTKQVQFVVVYNLSRFSRESAAHHALRGLFAGMGVALRSATEPIDDARA